MRKQRKSSAVLRILFLAVALLLLVLPASAQISQLRFRGFEVKSVVPSGFWSVKATVELRMVNPGGKVFDMKDVNVVIYRNGEPYVTGYCPSIPVAAGESTVKAVGTFRLSDGISLWSVFRTLLNIKIEEYSADVRMTALGDHGYEQPFMLNGFSVGSMMKSRRK